MWIKKNQQIKSVSALTEFRGFFGTLHKDASVMLKPQLCLRSHESEIIFLIWLFIMDEKWLTNCALISHVAWQPSMPRHRSFIQRSIKIRNISLLVVTFKRYAVCANPNLQSLRSDAVFDENYFNLSLSLTTGIEGGARGEGIRRISRCPWPPWTKGKWCQAWRFIIKLTIY